MERCWGVSGSILAASSAFLPPCRALEVGNADSGSSAAGPVAVANINWVIKGDVGGRRELWLTIRGRERLISESANTTLSDLLLGADKLIYFLGLLGFPGENLGSPADFLGFPPGSDRGKSRGVCYPDAPLLNIKRLACVFCFLCASLLALTRRQDVWLTIPDCLCSPICPR